MISSAFASHNGLLTATRLPALGRTKEGISAREVAILLLAGAVAACATGFVRAGLRIPGSSIVLAVLPMTLGLALVPRRLAGVIMAGGAFSTAGALGASGLVTFGPGAMTSLCLTGPLMDLAVVGAGGGAWLYVALVGAGLATNLIALLQRAGSKLLGFDGPGTRLFAEWWPQAVVSYKLSGAVAGLIGAALMFKFRHRQAGPGAEPLS
jgi:hypothetical protein